MLSITCSWKIFSLPPCLFCCCCCCCCCSCSCSIRPPPLNQTSMVCLRYEANKMIENFTIHAKCAAGYKGVDSAEMRGKVDFEMTVFLFLVLNQFSRPKTSFSVVSGWLVSLWELFRGSIHNLSLSLWLNHARSVRVLIWDHKFGS